MMFDIFKRLKWQKEELEKLKVRYDAAKELYSLYCGWTFAYGQTVIELFHRGEITEEQKNKFYQMATEYYDIWQTR